MKEDHKNKKEKKAKPKQDRRRKLERNRFEVLPGEGKRFSFRSFKQALVFYILLLLALLFLVQLGQHWLGEQFLAWRLKIITAEMGVMQQQVAVAGLVTRSEQVIEAPAAGMVLRLVPPGERVPVGAELAVFGAIGPNDMRRLQGSDEEEPAYALLEQFVRVGQQLLQEGISIEPEVEEDSLEHETTFEDDDNLEHHRDLELDLKKFQELIIINSEKAGLVSHYIDGMENYNGALFLTEEEFNQRRRAGTFTTEGDLLRIGEPMLKIVDNWHWRYNIIVPLHPGMVLTGIREVGLAFNFAPEGAVEARLEGYEVDQEKREVRLTYYIERQVSGFEQARWEEALLYYGRKQGIIIPAEALLKKDHGEGVYLNRGGRVTFSPVTVIEQQGDRVMVGGLEPYSLVISRPDLVEEGQRLN